MLDRNFLSLACSAGAELGTARVSRQANIRVNPMNNDINVLHHLGIISRNIEAAVRQYERLGFIFTPLTVKNSSAGGANPEPIGAGNRCAIFTNNYLEILGIVDASLWASITVEQRGPFDGPKMMQARTLSFPRGSNPEALLQIAQHETPEVVLQPRYMQHPNGAISITEVIVCVQDPDSVAKKYELYGDQLIYRSGALRVIDLGLSRIVVVSPDHLQEVLPGHAAPTIPFLAGFTVSSDLEITRQALKERGIEFQIHGGRIMVNARDGYGAAVLFESMDISS